MVEVHLDTDALIDLLEKEPLSKIIELAVRYDLKISAVVYFEFMVGAYRVKRLDLRTLVNKYFEVLPVTREVADKAARIESELMEKGELLEARDLIIAATAITRKAMLLTRNKKHYQRLKKYGLKFL
ncbi:MAG: hypothetical protein DRJ46_00830 [Thermoprotei archaeon]|nr:MAG: hypothetical protein DRJ46_00830 [Thermoprotei archaeon]